MRVALTIPRDGVVIGAYERAVVPRVDAAADGSRAPAFAVLVRMHGAVFWCSFV